MVVVEVEGVVVVVVVAVVGADKGWWLCLGFVVVDYYTAVLAFKFVKHGIPVQAASRLNVTVVLHVVLCLLLLLFKSSCAGHVIFELVISRLVC